MLRKVFYSFSMDFTSERNYVQREDGQWFTRYQYRDPRYGYKWSKWEKTSGVPVRGSLKGEYKVRLPKVEAI